MVLFLVKNLVRSIAVLLLVTFATFCLMYGNGRGIARSVLGLNATETEVGKKVIELGLDQPLPVQYGKWLGGVLTGDLGESFFTRQSVAGALANRLPVTLTLVLATLLLTAVLSVLLGVAAAVYGGWLDRAVQFLATLGTAIPAFIVAIALVFALAINVRLFPATGYVSPEDSVWGWIESVTLPVLALLVGSIAGAASSSAALSSTHCPRTSCAPCGRAGSASSHWFSVMCCAIPLERD